jgi:O-antigen ligase
VHLGLEPVIPWTLYLGFWAVVLLSIFKYPIAGLYYLVPLIPAQSFRDLLNGFPLGQNMVSIVFLAVLIGLIRQGEPIFPQSRWKAPVLTYVIFTFVSLCLGSFYLGSSWPISLTDPRVGNWRNYVTMLLLLFLVAAAVKTQKEMKILILLICLSVFLFDKSFWNTVSGRDFSSYSNDLRSDAGAVGYAGLNGLAAFEAQISIALLALAAFERNFWRKMGYAGLAFFSAICLMYSLSRGGYIALLGGWLFLGLVKDRKLLVLLVVFGATWTALVPKAVSERVTMTTDPGTGEELDHSSETRVLLWEDALEIFHTNPVTGKGFDTYAYTEHMNNYRDTHNIYLKVLVETGVVGLILFLWLIVRAFGAGYNLFRTAKDPFRASLGLALACWVVCSVVGNFFGDRWTFLQVNGYLWVLGGLVLRSSYLENEADDEAAAQNNLTAAEHGQRLPEGMFETPVSMAPEPPLLFS